MSGSEIGFRWLDLLEKDFDRACVELDVSLVDCEEEAAARDKLATLAACFSQLSHKALTVFQNAAKLEAELIHLRTSLAEVRASQHNEQSDGRPPSEASVSSCEASILARENQALRQTVLAQHSELCAARLATRYLEKELAGRIQQLQLMGRDVAQSVKERLWSQLEAEIALQRQKTLVSGVQRDSDYEKLFCGIDEDSCISAPRAVRIKRLAHQGLGISITGGAEHGMPIIISSIEENGPAWQSGMLAAGDAILSVDAIDLRNAAHANAAHALAHAPINCTLLVTRHYPVVGAHYGCGKSLDNNYALEIQNSHIETSQKETVQNNIDDVKSEEESAENDLEESKRHLNNLKLEKQNSQIELLIEKDNRRPPSPPTPTHKPYVYIPHSTRSGEKNLPKHIKERNYDRRTHEESNDLAKEHTEKVDLPKREVVTRASVDKLEANMIVDAKDSKINIDITEQFKRQDEHTRIAIDKKDQPKKKEAYPRRIGKIARKTSLDVPINNGVNTSTDSDFSKSDENDSRIIDKAVSHVTRTLHAHLANGDPDYGTPV